MMSTLVSCTQRFFSIHDLLLVAVFSLYGNWLTTRGVSSQVVLCCFPLSCFLRIGKSDVYHQPIAGLNSLAVCCPLRQWTHSSLWLNVFFECRRDGGSWTLKEMEWEDSQRSRAEEHATNHDTIKLRSDNSGGRKRGVPCGDLARHLWRLSCGSTSFCELCHGVRYRRSFWTATTAPTEASLRAMHLRAQRLIFFLASVTCRTLLLSGDVNTQVHP